MLSRVRLIAFGSGNGFPAIGPAMNARLSSCAAGYLCHQGPAVSSLGSHGLIADSSETGKCSIARIQSAFQQRDLLLTTVKVIGGTDQSQVWAQESNRQPCE